MTVYRYYEGGTEEIFTLSELRVMYDTEVDSEQKKQGTTFQTWIYEMKKMNILN